MRIVLASQARYISKNTCIYNSIKPFTTGGRVVEFSEINLPKPLGRLYQYWQTKCAGRPMPARADIYPSDMRDFLHQTMLLDVIAQDDMPPRFRVRLAGTHVVAAYGNEFTQKFNDEIDLGEDGEKILEACRQTVKDKRPVYINGVFQKQTDSIKVSYERLGLPLSTDGETVDMILVAVVLQRLSTDLRAAST